MVNTPISQVPNGQAITGATAAAVFTLDQCVIGGTTPKAGTFTTLTASSGTFTTVSADTPILVSNGGTGLATLTANNVILGNGTSTPSFVAPGASGNLLTSNGTAWVSSTPAAGSGAMTLLSTLTASSSTSVDFTSTFITTTYKNYRIIIDDLVFATDDANLTVRVSEDNGSTIKSTAGDYVYSGVRTDTNASSTGFGSIVGTAIALVPSSGSNAASYAYNGVIDIYNPSTSGRYKYFNWQVSYHGGASVTNLFTTASGGGAYVDTTNAVNFIQLLANTGNLASGTFKLYGIS